MPSKRIDELDARVVADADLLPVTPSGGPSGKATVAAIVAEGLSQPNSASSGAGANLSIIAADGVTSGAGGSIILEPGTQATTGGNGTVVVRQPGGSETLGLLHDGTNASVNTSKGSLLLIANSASGKSVKLTRSDVSTTTRNFTFEFDVPLKMSTADDMMIQYLIFKPSSCIIQSANSSHYLQLGSAFGIIKLHDTTTGVGSAASIAYHSSTPAAITTSQNNYVLNGGAFQRLNCTTASDITGIAPPTGGAHVDGRMIRLVSVGTATVTLKHNSASSTAANRMFVSSAADKALAVNAWADLVYDSTDNGSGAAGWRVM
jgi:hypothetical protein